MAASEAGRAVEPTQERRFRYRVAFFITVLVVLGLVVTLPFSVKSVVDDQNPLLKPGPPLRANRLQVRYWALLSSRASTDCAGLARRRVEQS